MKSLSLADTPLPSSLVGLFRRVDLWPLLLVATWELVLARRALGKREARDLISFNDVLVAPGYKATDEFPQLVAWAIPRVATRLPFRADCLVQAIAARRWLARNGIQTDLWIGTRKDRPQGFEAHAWLCDETRVIIGGDVSGFVPLILSRTNKVSP